LPLFAGLYATGWEFVHPFDRSHGTRTSGFVESRAAAARGLPGCYAGCQPSIVRAALRVLPPLHGFTFIDLGCGKGRPLFVAAEFPFRRLVGIEMSEALVRAARDNAAIMRQRFPDRVEPQIELRDASTFVCPEGDLAVFLYNPFPETVVRAVVAQLERSLARQARRVYVIYCNPVYGQCLDRSGAFRRFHAATVPYAEEELGYGPDTEDAVVIWQAGDSPAALPDASAAIRVTVPGTRAVLHPLH